MLRCNFLFTLGDKFLLEDLVSGEGYHVIREQRKTISKSDLNVARGNAWGGGSVGNRGSNLV